MNARKCVHSQKALLLSGIQAWIKHGRRKRDGEKEAKQEADGKKCSTAKQNTSEELKQDLPRHGSG